MPKINEYQQQTQVRNPIDQPRVSGEALSTGRGLAALGQGIGNAVDGTIDYFEKKQQKEEQDEKSNLNVKFSEAQASFTKDWQEQVRTGDGTDPDMAKNFIDRYDEYMGEIGASAKTPGGKKYFAENNAQLKGHLTKSVYAGQAELAGQKAKIDFGKALNFSTSALIDNPTGFEYARNQQDGYISGLVSSGRISELDGQQLKAEKDKQLAIAAVRGGSKLNPEYAKKELESGKWDQYLDASSKESLYGYIERDQNARETDLARRQSLEEKAFKAKQNVAYDDMMEKWSEGKLTARDVTDSILDPKEQRVLLTTLKREAKAARTLKSNPAKVNKMYERVVILPDGHPAKIANESQLDDLFMRGHISVQDHKAARDLLKKSKTEEGKLENKYKAAAYDQIKRTITGKSPREAEMLMGARQSYERAFAEGIRKGKSPEELTDPAFVAQVARPFIMTPKQKMEARVTQIRKAKEKVQKQEAQAKKTGEKPKSKFEMMQESLRKRGL